MKKILAISLVLLVATLSTAVIARAREVERRVPMLDEPVAYRSAIGTALGVSQVSSDTFYYGGTVMGPDSVPYADAPSAAGWANRKMWTWSSTGFAGTAHSGLNMDGWIGVDKTVDPADHFHVLSLVEIGGCVIDGGKSLFCGKTNSECVSQCYVDLNGTGYGNYWNQFVATDSATYCDGDVLSLTYDYANETEQGYDFTYVIVQIYDEVALAWVDHATLATYDDLVSGTEVIDLASFLAGTGCAQWRILFQFYSDGGWSDEDGWDPTLCGAVAFDDIVVAGTRVNWSEDFEDDTVGTLPPGWQKVLNGCGDFATAAHLNDLVVGLEEDPCVVALPGLCQIADSVIVFCDLDELGYPHPLCQDNCILSPLIDFSARPALAGKIFQVERFAKLPLNDHIFMYWQVKYKPGCESGNWSRWLTDNYVYYTREGTNCATWTIDLASYVPPNAEQAQIAMGVVNLCDRDPWGLGCSYTCNVTPYYDNATFATFGPVNAPYISMREIDYWQDQFSEDGTLSWNSTADTRIPNYQSNLVPPIFGDTLVCRGEADNMEVYFVFRMAKVSHWQATTHDFFSTWFPGVTGGGWIEARMDTAEVTDASGVSTVAVEGQWMCAFHEEDPVAVGNALAECTEILPNNIFVPGTRIEYFLKARYSDSAMWFLLPDTTGGRYEEFEILPMMRGYVGGYVEWPCLIVVDHFGQRGNWGERNSDRIIRHLEANGVDFDVFNKLGPSSDLRNGIARWAANIGQLGGPGTDKYNWGPGATSGQMHYAYRYCILNAGNVYGYSMYQQDAGMLRDWLLYSGYCPSFRFLWVSGDQVCRELNRRGPWGPEFLNTVLCASFVSSPYSDYTGDYTFCLPMNGIAGGRIECGEPESYIIRSNSCPRGRWGGTSVIDVSAASGCAAVAEVEYNAAYDATLDIAAVSNTVSVVGGPNYKTFTEGYDFCLIRTDDSQGPLACGPDSYISQWVGCILSWAEYNPNYDCPWQCPQDVDEPELPTAIVTSLQHAFPNPTNPTATIKFSIGAPGKVTLRIFDASGHVVRTLVEGTRDSGEFMVVWDGKNDRGEEVSSGVFFYQLEAPGFRSAKKIVILQ